MLLWRVAIYLAHRQHMASTGGLHKVLRVERIRREAIRFELDVLGRVDVVDIYLVVTDVCYFILFKLLGLGPLNIAEIHVVSSLYQLLPSIRIDNSSFDVLDDELVMVVHFFSFFSDLRCQQPCKRITGEPVTRRWHF